MSIGIQELRGRIIHSALHLEDEMDLFIAKFLSPKFKKSIHDESLFQILEKRFLYNKTLGNKIASIKEMISSKVFRELYFAELQKFCAINGLGISEEVEDYEEFKTMIHNSMKLVNETRNSVAHGRITYDFLMGSDEISEGNLDRTFLNNNKFNHISKTDEEVYNNHISKLIGYFKFMTMVILSSNYEK